MEIEYKVKQNIIYLFIYLFIFVRTKCKFQFALENDRINTCDELEYLGGIFTKHSSL